VAKAIFFWGNLVMTTIIGIANKRGRRGYQAELWIMKSSGIGETGTRDSFKRVGNNISRRD
jgi:hypothetical protein